MILNILITNLDLLSDLSNKKYPQSFSSFTFVYGMNLFN